MLENLLYTATGSLAQRVLSSLGQLYLARVLGPAVFAAVSYPAAVLTYAGIPVAWGADIVGMREVSREPRNAREIYARLTAYRLMLAALVVPLMVLYGWRVAPAIQLKWLTGIYAVQLIAFAVSPGFALCGLEKMGTQAAISTGVALFQMVGFAVAVHREGDLGVAVSIIVAGPFLLAIASQLSLGWRLGADLRLFDWSGFRGFLRQGAPIVSIWLASGVSMNADLLMAARYGVGAELGIYAVAWKVRAMLMSGNSIIQSAIMPRLAAGDERSAAPLHAAMIAIEGTIGLLLGGALILAGGPLARLMLGKAYAGSGPVLSAIGVHLAAMYTVQAVVNPLMVWGRHHDAVIIYATSALCSGGGGLIGGALAGVLGIAIGIAAGEIVGLIAALMMFADLRHSLAAVSNRMPCAVAASLAVACAAAQTIPMEDALAFQLAVRMVLFLAAMLAALRLTGLPHIRCLIAELKTCTVRRPEVLPT